MKIEFYDSRDKISHWPFFISLALSFLGLFFYFAAGAGAAGHSRFIYDLGRLLGLLTGFALLYLVIRQWHKAFWMSVVAGVPSITFILIFVFCTYVRD